MLNRLHDEEVRVNWHLSAPAWSFAFIAAFMSDLIRSKRGAADGTAEPIGAAAVAAAAGGVAGGGSSRYCH